MFVLRVCTGCGLKIFPLNDVQAVDIYMDIEPVSASLFLASFSKTKSLFYCAGLF